MNSDKKNNTNNAIKGTYEIIRVKRLPSSFVQMHKGFFDDHRLSFKAKGILGYLLTKPDNWEVRITDLMNHAKDGRDSIYAGLAELKTHGYYSKIQVRGENGRLSHWESLICEVPMPPDSPNEEKPDTAKSFTDNPNTAKLFTEKPYSAKPYSVKPFPAEPYTENPHISNNNLTEMHLTENEPSDIELSNNDHPHRARHIHTRRGAANHNGLCGNSGV